MTGFTNQNVAPSKATYFLNGSGRHSAYADDIWRTFSNSYGPSNIQNALTVGSGTTPQLLTTCLGLTVPIESTLKNFTYNWWTLTDTLEAECSLDILRNLVTINIDSFVLVDPPGHFITHTSKDYSFALQAGDQLFISTRNADTLGTNAFLLGSYTFLAEGL